MGHHYMNIYKDRILSPHMMMQEVEKAYGTNPIFRNAIDTITDFIFGGDITFKCDDKMSEVRGNQLIKDLEFNYWVPHAIRPTVRSGNGYVEMDFNPMTGLPQKFYPQAASSRWYINCDEHGKPRDPDEYYIQQVDPGVKIKDAKWFDLSYFAAGKFKYFRIYGIPVPKDKVIHFRMTMGPTETYGESHFMSCLDDNQILHELERSIAVIARYKAVPRKILELGDKDNPATGEETDDFILYLESLERDEDPIVNKPVKMQDLSYAGGDINLDYMFNHIRKKLFGGVIPDFLTGYGDQVNRATAQVQLISWVLSIYAKRKVFIREIERDVFNPWLEYEGLEKGELCFNELDFEEKGEKSTRVIQEWTANIHTLNRAKELLGESKLGDDGDVYYQEWTNTLMSKGMPGGGQSPDEFGIDDSSQGGFEEDDSSPYDEMTPDEVPDTYDLQSQAYNPKDFDTLRMKEEMGKETLSMANEEFEVDPTGLTPLVSHTSIYIRNKFNEKYNQVKVFSGKKSLEVLKEDLRAKDIRELATFLRVGNGDIKQGVDRAIELAFDKGNRDASKKIGKESPYPMPMNKMATIQKQAWKVVQKNLERGTENIEGALVTGMMGKATGKELEREIEKAYSFVGWKSEQLARTELQKAYSKGVEYVMKNSPNKWYIWKTSLKDNVCPTCRPRHGKNYSILNKMEPKPPLHPNCNCGMEIKRDA